MATFSYRFAVESYPLPVELDSDTSSGCCPFPAFALENKCYVLSRLFPNNSNEQWKYIKFTYYDFRGLLTNVLLQWFLLSLLTSGLEFHQLVYCTSSDVHFAHNWHGFPEMIKAIWVKAIISL